MDIAKAMKLRTFLLGAREEFGHALTVQKLQVLLEVMLHPGIEQGQLIERTNQTRSAISKSLADWSAFTSQREPGPGLLESRINPMNRVAREIHPTEKGRLIWAKVIELLD